MDFTKKKWEEKKYGSGNIWILLGIYSKTIEWLARGLKSRMNKVYCRFLRLTE